ncbi:MAG: AMP-binding protein [Betaproteobacteria bacterium]|nr:AMP-binding protein [Betaproteobacteria bacterium]
MRVIDYFYKGYEKNPDHVFLITDDEKYSYRESRKIIDAIGAALAKNRIGHGGRVAVYSPNHPLAFLCMLGLLRTGATWVPLNARNTVETNAEFMAYTETEFLFYHSEFAEHLPQLKERVATLRGFVCIDREDGDNPSLERFMREQGNGSIPTFDDDPTRLVGILATGGTTGPSKGVMETEQVWETMTATGIIELQADLPPVMLAAAPLTHAAGVMGMVMMAMGATLVIRKGFDAEDVCRCVQQHKVTHMFLPPTALYAMLAFPRVREYDFSSMRRFLIAASPVSPDKFKEAVEVFGPCMCQCYGQAEAPFFLTFLPCTDVVAAAQGRKPHLLESCGRATVLSRVEVMADDGTLLPAGERGEIVVRGNIVMPGYYNKPAETAEIRTFNWHHTGDVGYKDEEGYFYIVDRKKDMVITGGFNVFSAEVEKAVLAHPAVQDCAVIGVPDAKWGEAIKAIVVLKPGTKTTEEDLITHCKINLESMKAPKSVEFVDALPRTPVGKINKKLIREKYWGNKARQVN